MTLVQPTGDGKHLCYQGTRFDQLDSAVGRCIAEASRAGERADVSVKASERTFEAVMELKRSFDDAFARHETTDHAVVNRRLNRLEDHDDAEGDNTRDMPRTQLVSERAKARNDATAARWAAIGLAITTAGGIILAVLDRI